jgi:hypothetical protein
MGLLLCVSTIRRVLAAEEGREDAPSLLAMLRFRQLVQDGHLGSPPQRRLRRMVLAPPSCVIG